MNDTYELPPEDRAPQQQYRPISFRSRTFKIVAAALLAFLLFALLGPGTVHDLIVGDSVAHSDTRNTHGFVGDNAPGSCQDTVSETGLSNQRRFITSDSHRFVRQGNVAYYHIPGSGVTLNYSYDDCMFSATVRGDTSVADQVSMRRQSTGTVLPASSIGWCKSTVSPQIASSGGPGIPVVYLVCK